MTLERVTKNYYSIIQGIVDIISAPGLINVEFADIREFLGEAGSAQMGHGIGKGDNGFVEAAEMAVRDMQEFPVNKADKVLLNITGGTDLSVYDVTEALDVIIEAVDPETEILFGVVVDDTLKDEVRVTIVASRSTQLWTYEKKSMLDENMDVFRNDVEEKNVLHIRDELITIAHEDRGFYTTKFDDALAYARNANIENLFDSYNNESFKPKEEWDEEYWRYIASSLMDNFCEERINHLKEVGRYVYPK